MGLVSKAILTILMCLLTGGQGMLFICTNWSIGCVSKVILTILMCLLTGGLCMLFICLTAQWAVFLKPFWQFDVSANRGSRYAFYMLDCSMGCVSNAILTIFMCLLTGVEVYILYALTAQWAVFLVIFTIFMCLLTGGWVLFLCSDCSMGCVSLVIVTILMCLLAGGSRYAFYMIWLLNGPCF